MKSIRLADLPDSFRETAAHLRENAAAVQAAAAWERAADRVEAALRDHGAVALTVREAALECGYSVGHLARMIRDANRNELSVSRKELSERLDTVATNARQLRRSIDGREVLQALIHAWAVRDETEDASALFTALKRLPNDLE